MADLTLAKKDTINIPARSQLKLEQVLIESRENHNEIVDAIHAMNNVLAEIKLKLDSNPAQESNTAAIVEIKETLIPAMEARANTNLQKVKAELTVKVDNNSDKIVGQEGHSRRRNVIGNGIKFVEGENTKEVAINFLIEDLKMDPAAVANFLFRDIHRLPAGKIKTKDGIKKGERPIIMAFLRQEDRNAVMRKAFELKGTDYSIKSDLPKSLNELRSNMLQERRRLMTANPGVKYRVGERSYKPVLQKEAGSVMIRGEPRTKWVDIPFTTGDISATAEAAPIQRDDAAVGADVDTIHTD